MGEEITNSTPISCQHAPAIDSSSSAEMSGIVYWVCLLGLKLRRDCTLVKRRVVVYHYRRMFFRNEPTKVMIIQQGPSDISGMFSNTGRINLGNSSNCRYKDGPCFLKNEVRSSSTSTSKTHPRFFFPVAYGFVTRRRSPTHWLASHVNTFSNPTRECYATRRDVDPLQSEGSFANPRSSLTITNISSNNVRQI